MSEEVRTELTGDEDLRLAATVLSHREYILLLSVLRQQVVTGELAEDDFALLLYSLVAEDLVGDKWTYAPESGSWFKVNAEEWLEGEPRGPLLVAMPDACSAILRGVSARVEQIEGEVRRGRLPSGTLATQHRDVAQPAFCTGCGKQLVAGQAFCSGCGKPVGVSAGRAATESVRRCPACGRAVAGAKSFCTGCGTAVPGASPNG